jgi:proline racemase
MALTVDQAALRDPERDRRLHRRLIQVIEEGCVLQAPIDPRADIGVLYIEASGHLPVSGHDTIGLVTVLVEAGLVEAVEPVTQRHGFLVL